jgi:hypothetical protein
MLTRLKRLLLKEGRLTTDIINASPDTPCAPTYFRRFGSMRRAYKLIGYEQKVNLSFVEVRRQFYQRSLGVIGDVVAECSRLGLAAKLEQASRLLTIGNEFTISIFVLRCLRTNCGSLQWNLRCRRNFCSDIIVAVRMDSTNKDILDYLLLPTRALLARLRSSRLRFSEGNPGSFGARRFGTFDGLLCALRTRAKPLSP